MSLLSLLSFLPFLPLPFSSFLESGWVACRIESEHWWFVHANLSLPLDFCCTLFVPGARMFWHIDCVPLFTLHRPRGVVFSALYVMLLEGLTVSAHPSLGCGSCFSENEMYVFFLYPDVQLVFLFLFVSYWTFSEPLTCLSILGP